MTKTPLSLCAAPPSTGPAEKSISLHALLALVAIVIALWSLIGWIGDVPVLTTFFPGRPALSPMTVLGLLVTSVAAAVLPGEARFARRLGWLALVAGLGIVAAHLTRFPVRGWIPPEWWSSPITGGLFAMAGFSIVLLAAGRYVPGQALAFSLLMFSVLVAFAHAVPWADLYAYLPGTGVAIPTVAAFTALAVSLLLACRDSGIAGALTRRSAAGRVGLRLLLTGAGVVVLLMGGVLAARRHDVFDADTAVLLLAWGASGILGGALWRLALVVDRAASAQLAAENERDDVRRMVAAAITHDLRAPLHVATLSASLLERLVTDPRPTATLHRLRRSHRRLDRLLRSLLDSLAIEKGRTPAWRMSRFALDELVAEVIDENEAVFTTPVVMKGRAAGRWDRDALFRVIENLLLNAQKYGDGGKPIHCDIAETGRGEALLSVSNDGPSIPRTEWDAIFEPFKRGAGSAEAAAPGWGVGLAYARLVATAHGGTLRVAASQDRRTVFELRLPLDGAAAAAAPSSRPHEV